MVKTLSLEHMEEAIVGVIDQAISDAAGVPLPPATPAVSLITSAHSLVETVSIVETTERAASITTETASVRAEISSSVAATTSKIASPDQPADASADGITAETREPAPQAGQPLTASDEALLDKDAMPGWPSFAQHQETQQQAADPECALDGDIEADTADEDSLVIVNSKSAEQDSDDGKLSSDREPSQQDKLAVGEESQVQCEVKPLLSHLDHIANAVNDRDDRAVSEDVSDNDEDDADDDDDKSRSGSEDDASEDDASENGDSSEYDESDNEETALLSTTEIASHGQESQAQAQERELSTTEKMLVDFMTPGVNGSAVVVMYLVLGCIASIFVTLYFATQNIHCLGVVAVVFILTGLITWYAAIVARCLDWLLAETELALALTLFMSGTQDEGRDQPLAAAGFRAKPCRWRAKRSRGCGQRQADRACRHRWRPPRYRAARQGHHHWHAGHFCHDQG
ncbi:hypothetical protein BC831DRAFT_86116 [Entophlyctis helioformis]|nr:hypothetical protein BC831DRAFT_86116 [Entophlyctis helioformis]